MENDDLLARVEREILIQYVLENIFLGRHQSAFTKTEKGERTFKKLSSRYGWYINLNYPEKNPKKTIANGIDIDAIIAAQAISLE